MRENLAGRGKSTTSTFRTTPLVLASLFILMMLAGIALDEPQRVLEQAKRICFECIGLG